MRPRADENMASVRTDMGIWSHNGNLESVLRSAKLPSGFCPLHKRLLRNRKRRIPVRTVVVVGAGFSGAVTAAHLVRAESREHLSVILVNRSSLMARGVAYGTRSPHHVLNVPAGNMSALADDPENFLQFCRRLDPQITSGSFVARQIYGDYLDCLLRETEASAGHNVALTRVVGEVVGLKPAPDGRSASVALGSGTVVQADRVVLAFGHFPPRDPPVADGTFYTSERYVRDPWAAGSAERIGDAGPVLLIGTGLTALDVCVSLAGKSPQRPIYAVSRRGLLPQSHRSPAHPPPPSPLAAILERIDARVLGYSRAIRAEVTRTVERGGDWRDVLAALRAITPLLWRRLDSIERARFLRHLQPYWDVCRHRAAPDAHSRFRELMASGTLQIIAGRLLSFSETADGVDVTLRRRGERSSIRMKVSRVVNCTGPTSDPGQRTTR